ncbi:S8 family peptidase [Streptomyces sp. FIT100]|uniref:S8 family peptidase n=1 Tax=Streptomyces sp. FIT100 TaxID=2837956 RepID=UPI0021CA13AE|nr:S8 family peptidase [Streptomyces sp. FIT100]UUN25022.1 S8 family peptidase [Streptomyces sp. FIT100]
MRSRSRTAAVVAATTVALLATGLPAAAAPDPGPAAARPAAPTGAVPAQHTVTLVSGDRVALTGSGDDLQVSGVTPGRGREHIAFTRARAGGHEYVIPVDATQALADGRVDRQLFDVTVLASQGYDDAARADIPLITTAQAGSALRGSAQRETYPALGLTARSVRKSEAAAAWQGFLARKATRGAEPGRLWLDARVEASLDRSVALTGAPAAWRDGLDGKGVKVAVLDTGYDPAHPDLKGKVTAEKNFTWDESTTDLNGHGTHVASTVAGSGAASKGRYKGVAPGAELLIGKVLDAGGSGTFSGILEGMEWASAQGADIVSMSLGSSLPSDGSDPLSQAVETLSADGGPLFVVAAGNDGAPRTIGSPAAAPSALTVGSVTKDGAMSSFSSRGPALADGGVKPEITAPGSAITAARAAGTLDSAADSAFYATISGTSMATPHVSGAAAILKQRHPDWDARQLKAALVASADPVDGAGVYDQGAGSVDVPGALAARVTASPAAVSAKLAWPYTGTPTRTVTYRNGGAEDVRLSLSLDGRAPVSLAARQLTVPAGGTAEATVRIDTDRASAGAHSAWITARGSDGRTVRTPVGVDAEGPSATLTLEPAARRPGVEAAYTNLVVQNEKTGEAQLVGLTTGPAELRLPLGDYRVFGGVWEYVAHGEASVPETSVALARRVSLTGDRTLTTDLSGAKPVTMGVDDPDMRLNERGSATGIVSSTGAGEPTGLAAPLYNGAYRSYAVGSGRIPGLTYFSAGSWEQPYVLATTVGGEGGPVDVPVRLVSWQRLEWDLEKQVVDAGSGEDLSGLELKDRIVLFQTGWPVPWDEQDRRYAAIKAQQPAAILMSGYASFDVADPPLGIDAHGVALLRERLAKGGVTLRIKGQRNGERTYFTFHTHEDGLPAGAHWQDRRRELARVEHSFRTTGYPNDPKGVYGWVTHRGLRLAQQSTLFKAPHRMTAYYTPDVPWTTATFEYLIDADGPLGVQYSNPTVHRKGRTVSDNWLTGPFNPSLSVTGPDGRAQATRDGDKLRLALPMFSDAAGHRSDPARDLESGETVLRDGSGTVLDRNDQPGQGVFDVPGRGQWYELTSSAHRDNAEWSLGTKVTDVWRFRSEHTSRERPLALLDTRYDMAGLDGDNSVPEDRAFTFGLGFGRQSGAGGRADVDRVSVQYSTDDGASWLPADVRGRHGARQVTVPALKSGWVSLRVTGEEHGGASLTETVTRAYRVGCPEYWCAFAPGWPHWPAG